MEKVTFLCRFAFLVLPDVYTIHFPHEKTRAIPCVRYVDILFSNNNNSYDTVSRNTSHCNFQLFTLSKSTILFQILQTKMMIFGITTNTTCRFSFKQYNLFFPVQGHEICPFMETVPYVFWLIFHYFNKLSL